MTCSSTNKLRFGLVSLLVLSLFGICETANALDIVYLDFGRNTNQTTGQSDTYNNIGDKASGLVTDGDAYDLLDIDGVDTLVDLTINPNAATGPTSGSFAGAGADYGGAYPTEFSGIATTALEDSIFIRNTNGLAADVADGSRVEFELTGLDPLLSYELLIYGGRGNSGGDSTHYFASDDGGENYSPSQSFDVFNNASNFAKFTGLSGDSSISLIVTTDNDNDTVNGAINFMRITTTPVPEPASAYVFAIAGIGCLLRRRK